MAPPSAAQKSSTSRPSEASIPVSHYIGIDVGTGSARACIVSDKGDIVGLDSQDIGLWQPQEGFYVSLSLLPHER